MTPLRLSFLFAGLALAGAPLASAAVNPAIVPADAQWVLHADLVALRETVLGQKLIELLPPIELTKGDDPVRPNIRKILETVGTATAFGSDLSGKPEAIDGALVLQGTAELRKIAEGLVAQMSLTDPDNAVEISDLPFEAYRISGELFVAFPTEPIVVVSKSRKQLVNALDVFRGQAPSLAQGKPPMARLLPSGGTYYLMGASVVPSAQQLFQGDGPEARILQMAQSGSLALGETGELAVARVQLTASSADVATKLVKIIEGITAMVSLAETDDERLTAVVRSLQVQRADTDVSLGFSYPTARILEWVQSAQQAGHDEAAAPPSAPAPAKSTVEGEVVADWTANQTLGGAAPTAHNFATRTIDAVTLARGATVVLTGRRHDGEHARWDYIELTPAAGMGVPQRFEAEYMRLHGYAIEGQGEASGGEVIKTDGNGTARLRFTGQPGTYAMTVGYVDEQDGEAFFAISIIPPDTAD